MRFYAVIDTNVLVSALLAKRADSPTVEIVAKLFDGSVTPVFSREILEEYSEVLHRDKFGFSASTVDIFLHELRQIGILLEPEPAEVVLPNIKDIPFYVVTLSNGENDIYLVTENLKHFPAKPFIVTPAQFLKLLQKAD